MLNDLTYDGTRHIEHFAVDARYGKCIEHFAVHARAGRRQLRRWSGRQDGRHEGRNTGCRHRYPGYRGDPRHLFFNGWEGFHFGRESAGWPNP